MPIKFWSIFALCAGLVLIAGFGPIIGAVLFGLIVYVFYFNTHLIPKLILAIILPLTIGIPVLIITVFLYAIVYGVWRMTAKAPMVKPQPSAVYPNIIEAEYTVVYPSR